MKMFNFRTLILTFFLQLFFTSAANAYNTGSLTVCNKGSAELRVAILYDKSPWVGWVKKNPIIKGWYYFVPGQCSLIYNGPTSTGFASLKEGNASEVWLAVLAKNEKTGQWIPELFKTKGATSEYCVHPTDAFSIEKDSFEALKKDCPPGYVLMPFGYRGEIYRDRPIALTLDLYISNTIEGTPLIPGNAANSGDQRNTPPQETKLTRAAIKAQKLAPSCQQDLSSAMDLYNINHSQAAKAYLNLINKCRHPTAFFQLGVMHWKGYGVSVDFINSLKWYLLSLEHEFYTGAISYTHANISELKAEMTEAQIAKAYMLAEKWLGRPLECCSRP